MESSNEPIAGSIEKYLFDFRDYPNRVFSTAVRWLEAGFEGDISKLIMKISLPASIFSSVISYLDASQLASFAGGLLIGVAAVAVSYLIGFFLVKLLAVRHGRRGVFINLFANAGQKREIHNGFPFFDA
jgi:hypothetical protein